MNDPPRKPRLARIPPHLLHVTLDDLPRLGVPDGARAALVNLLADLPAVPRAADGAVLAGPDPMTLPCLAVVARHVGQALRDHNVALLHDRARLRAGRLKLGFLSLARLLADQADLDKDLRSEAALFITGLTWPLPAPVATLLASRTAADLATFGSARTVPSDTCGWRTVGLECGAA